MTETEEILACLKESRTLGKLPDDLLRQLIPLSTRVSFPAGNTILKEGTDNTHVFILISGNVSVYSNGEFIVKLQRRGDIFGEMSVITGNVSTASVIADDPVEALGIKARDIGQYNLMNAESLENNFFRIFARILSEKLALTTLKARKHEIANRQLMETQKKLEHANSEALQAVQAKAAFLAMMSHEIRTPLNSIIGNTELLYYTDPTEEQEKHLNTVYKAGELLLSIINNILDFSTIEAGELKIEQRRFNLKDLFFEIGEMFESTASQKGIDLHIVYEDAEAFYQGDQVRIRQILTNLVGNAIKFTADGFVKLSIERTTADETADHLLIRVTDTGIGIPAEKHAQIFEEFSQADVSTTRKFGGTGLGLAISRNLVKMMGGEINVQSKEGHGSEFRIRLALPRDQQPTEA